MVGLARDALSLSWCTDLQPNIGVTGAPVYDPANGNVYLVAQVVTSQGYVQYHMFGISAATGAISMNQYIGGHPVNDANITFSGKYENARPGLLLMNGWVYAAFASHCDHQPYAGFVTGVNVSTRAETLWTDESGVTDNQAGIWQSGGGLLSDGPGRIFFTSGNGISPPPGPGAAPPGQLAESTVRLAVQPDGSLAAQSFFSPANAPSLDAADTDFGSGGPAGFPVGTATYPHMLVQAGKDGRIFLLNSDSLGGRAQGPGGTDAVLGELGPYAGQWGHPAVFEADTSPLPSGSSGTGDYVYYVGSNDYLRTLQLSASAAGAPVLTDIANSSFRFQFSSGSPVVTLNGTDPSSALVWLVRAGGSTGANGTLYAFNAQPPGTCTGPSPCTQQPIWSAAIGTASKFTIPATSNGMVYVGSRDGHVLGFGVAAAAALPAAKPVAFGQTSVGSAAATHVTVTAARKITVSGVSATTTASDAPSPADQFALGQVTESKPGSRQQVPVTFPVTLRKGDALRVPVTFTPAAPGGVTGLLSFATGAAGVPPVTTPLYGGGTQTGLYAATTAPRITFSWVRHANQGKKRAQCVTFAGDNADIFITLDSDTTLERDAIAEGLKPFADPRVQSVAGLELAWNHDRNLLTRIKSVNTVIWQFITCSAQNAAAGNNLVNRGTFALYRAPVIRDNVDAYLGETLFGRPVRLGDDSMLTLFAFGRGRAVQQTTAVSFAMYPETFSHTFRQWTRWMRGTSVRTMWRLRYLPLASWGWWYNFLTTWWYLAFLGILGSAVLGFGSSWRFLLTAMVFSAGWVWVMAVRMFLLRRSDQTALQVAEAFALVPLAIAWMALVLRPIRLYGNLTMLRQGWVTRVHGAEAMAPAGAEPPEAAAREFEAVP